MAEERESMDDVDNVEGEVPAEQVELESRAKVQGWSPKDQWRGDPKDWVDAATFVKRADEINPILRANSRRLEDQLVNERRERERLEQRQKELDEQIGALKEFNAEQVKLAAEAEVKRIAAKVKQAREDGDVEREAELLADMGIQKQIAAGKAEQPVKEPVRPEPRAVELSEDVKEFMSAHPELNTRPWMGAKVMEVYKQMGTDGEIRGRPVRESLEEAWRRTQEFFAPLEERGRNGGKSLPSRGGGRQQTKGFADMPQEAQDAGLRWAKRLAGPGKAWSTEEKYLDHFAGNYWSQQTIEDAIASGRVQSR